MGIRISKIIGWGVEDTTGLENYHPECIDYDGATTGDFLDWAVGPALEDRGEKSLGKTLSDDELWMARSVLEMTRSLFDNEENLYGDHEVWDSMVQPEFSSAFVAAEVGFLKERLRYDDNIDYYEQAARQMLEGREPEVENQFLGLDMTIFPHENYEFSDGRIEGLADHRLRVSLERALAKGADNFDGGEKTIQLIQESLDKIADKYGFEDHASYKSDIHPEIPLEVMLALHWSGVIDSPEVIRKNLRPCIYTWWS